MRESFIGCMQVIGIMPPKCVYSRHEVWSDDVPCHLQESRREPVGSGRFVRGECPDYALFLSKATAHASWIHSRQV
jgi:hypothetical protein